LSALDPDAVYGVRAERELRQSQKASLSRAEAARYLALARADMERARNLYEPIDGYSNVGSNLKRLDRDRDRLQVLLARNEKPVYARKMSRRLRTWR